MNRWHLVTGDCAPGYSGGVATWTEAVARGLRARGAEVVLHARGALGVGRLAEARWDAAQPFAVHRIRVRAWNASQGGAAPRAVLPHIGPGDRVLATTWPLAPGFASPCARLGVPLVVVAHGSEVSRLVPPAPTTLRALADVARFGAVSAFLAARLAALGVHARVLPAPVDPLPPGGGPRDGLAVVARCTALKGVDRALRLGAVLGWPVTVVGDGSELPALRRLARTLPVEARFEGRLPRTGALAAMARARVLVQLSREDAGGAGAEGLGLVVLEAMACGTPAAVSAVGGLPEAVGPGLVLDDPDDAVACAARLEAWLGSTDRGAEQRAYLARRHGVGRCVDALLEMGEGRGT